MNDLRIAIVGAGACGIVCLSELVARLIDTTRPPQNVHIFLFDKSEAFGTGVAYGTPLDAHLLNLRARYMSARPDDEDHFLNWLNTDHKHRPTCSQSSDNANDIYPPRRLYGSYLTDLFHRTVATAQQHGISVKFVQNMVTDITIGDTIELLSQEGLPIECDSLILTLGNFPSTLYRELKVHKTYIPYPWPASNLWEAIPPDKPVAVIGAGLSAVDTLFTLLEKGHQERIYFLSRTGLLPKVQGADATYSPKFFTLKNIHCLPTRKDGTIPLSEIALLYRQELANAYGHDIDWAAILNPHGSPLEILQRDIAEAESGPIAYQRVLNEVADIFSPVWNMLSVEDRQLFDRIYKTLWHVHQYPMPLCNARKIAAIIHSGQLQIVSGLHSVDFMPERSTFRLTLQSRFGPCYSLEAPYVINATGQGKDVHLFEDQLIQNLLKKRVLTSHINGGIQVDFDTCAVIQEDTTPSPRLFAVGELTRGVHFLTNALGENIKCAQRMTACLLQQAIPAPS